MQSPRFRSFFGLIVLANSWEIEIWFPYGSPHDNPIKSSFNYLLDFSGISCGPLIITGMKPREPPMGRCVGDEALHGPCEGLINPVHTQSRYSPLLKQTRLNSGLRYYKNSSLRSTTSEETSVESTPYVKDEPKDEPDSVITVEDARPVENSEEYNPATQIDEKPQEDSLYYNPKEYNPATQIDEKPQEDSLLDNPMKVFEFLENFDLKFDTEDTNSILAFGGGALVAVWVASAVVGAIDSIPVFPKVLELVGLGYTIWFTTRYLIFKENRAELAAKIEQIKEEVIGSKDY
ncbi:protein CURVATURE THYLAKOID 1D [Abeliophyllum distichum]|uniref:Protein CURVATURE THYLAKOID 1D n=1 Tax=Abeliophyllum distichum TaxID=126358 RepID=A0ABD1V1W9_9LAMI